MLFCRIRVKSSMLYREKLYENLLVLASSCERQVRLRLPERERVLLFYMFYIAGKCNFKCKLRYLEPPNQVHLRMKNVS